jgi:hypothetical protein
MATLASGGNIWWGLTFGLTGAFFGEFFAALFTAHGDTHIDPPCWAVGLNWILIDLFAISPLSSVTGAVPVLVAAVVAGLGYVIFRALQKTEKGIEELPDMPEPAS